MGHGEQRRGRRPNPELQAQIKTRERVQSLAEVYTHEREVNAMLDLVEDMFPSAEDPGNTDRLFLEPACGHGNFLVEILRRKLATVTPDRYGYGEEFEHRVLRCLGSTYGVDINEDNVDEARERLRALLAEHLEGQLEANSGTADLWGAVEAILATNVICADTLAGAAGIEMVAYIPAACGTFIREWSCPLDPLADDLSLFAPELRRDAAPVHYADLADQARPTVTDSPQQEVA